MDVLVVEDQVLVREVLVAVAASAFRGARVRAVADLDEAIYTANVSPVDAVLLDLGLPGCHGIEALRRFRTAFPKIPVVVISASEDNQVIAEALAAGAAGYIPKALSARGMADALRGSALG